ncbi:MAG: amino acid transporter, partial [Candidatus Thermoplasmatota archaeon]|nr:amino acid transporter [Candidatus Thermoplasmatota archaeon]
IIVYHKRKGLTKTDFMAGIWLPVYMIVVLGLSFIGSSNFGGIDLIVFPYDVILFIMVTLVFYYIGYYSGLKYEGTGVEEA